MSREDYDRQIRVDEVKKGDQLHLTVMGGDEYVEVTFKRSMQHHTILRWISWGGEVTRSEPHDLKVWVKK